jgi:GNAT superfamily N-acetyltransferase
MNIRIATEAEIPQMHQVRMSVHENQLSNPLLVQPQDYQKMLSRRGRGWVAEAEDRIAGFAIADLERNNVWALFVHPEFEGRGIGRELHSAMMEWFFGAGAERVWLSTAPGTRAETFYKSAGWRLVGREANGELRFEMSNEDWRSRSAST